MIRNLTHVLNDSGARTTLRADANNHLHVTDSSLNSKISKGQGVIAAGGEIQQVLTYGRKDDGTLQPLECNGDRLLVDVVELAGSGPISTSTALSSIQVCGIDSAGDNRFKTLKCDANGVLQTHSTLQDIRLGNIDTKLTDGTQKSLMLGNTAADGSGTSNALHIDGNGIAKTQVVNAVNVIPHSTLNGLGTPTASVNTTIANQPNIKLEDLSSTIDSDHTNHSRSIAVGIRGRTDISNHTTGTHCLVTSNGLQVVSSGHESGQWFASEAIGDDEYNDNALDCRTYSKVRLYGKAATSITSLHVMGSFEESGTYYNLTSNDTLQQMTPEIGGVTEYHLGVLIDNPPPYLKVYNASGLSVTLELDYKGVTN